MIAMTAPEPSPEEAEASTLYSVCFFDRNWIVPEVQFLEAENDRDALAFAKSMRPRMTSRNLGQAPSRARLAARLLASFLCPLHGDARTDKLADNDRKCVLIGARAPLRLH